MYVKSITKSGGTCYHYEVIDAVCIAVEFKVNQETATYGWSYVGGCFEDGRIANYVSAVPGRDYSFDHLDFEVREYNPGLLESAGSIFSLSGIFGVLSVLCLIGAFVAGGFAFIQLKKASQGGEESSVNGDVQMGSL